jgi:hypothetical protein
MPEVPYPSKIAGFRFLQQRDLPPVATCWDFQTTEALPVESARQLLRNLPEDWELSYFDPEAGDEEGWIFVRRLANRFLIKRVRRGFSPWAEQSFERVLTSFASSPLVQKPAGSFASFTVSRIPDHQRYKHINKTA